MRSAASVRKLVDSFNANFPALSALNIADIYQAIYAPFVLSRLDISSVSYTHLDVYKRQVYGRVTRFGIGKCHTSPLTALLP